MRAESDLVALAGTGKGPIGSHTTVRIGVRNDGPGGLPASVRVECTVPEGTTVVSSPYDVERDEEPIDQECRALSLGGEHLTTASARQPRARRYVCTARAGAVGTTTPFPFTLRIDKEVPRPGGESPSPTVRPLVPAMTPPPRTTPPRWPYRSGRSHDRRLAAVAGGNNVSESAVHRWRDELITLLAAQAPRLDRALKKVAWQARVCPRHLPPARPASAPLSRPCPAPGTGVRQG